MALTTTTSLTELFQAVLPGDEKSDQIVDRLLAGRTQNKKKLTVMSACAFRMVRVE